MTEHQFWDELAAGYALHALAPDEQLMFSVHLVDCARCARNVDEHALTAAQLGSLAHSEEVAEAPSWSSVRRAVLDDTAAVPPAPVIDLAARRRRYDISRRTLAAAAAVAVLAGGGVATWRLTSGSSGRATPAVTASQVTTCRSSTTCHVVALRSAQDGNAEASVLVNDNGGVDVVSAALSTAPANQMYVLWQVARDGRPIPVSEFTDAGDRAQSHGTISVAYSDLLEFALSAEPSNQLPSKPSKILAVGTTT